jgi:hypothetical protein
VLNTALAQHIAAVRPERQSVETPLGPQPRTQAAAERILEYFPEIERMAEALRNGQPVAGMDYGPREQAREHILEELGVENYQPTPDGVDIELIKVLGRAAGDEDASTHIPVLVGRELRRIVGVQQCHPRVWGISYSGGRRGRPRILASLGH